MKQFFRDAWLIAAPYWRSPERWMALALLFVIVALNLGNVYLNVLLNGWYNNFYNALQNMDKPGFWAAIIRFLWLAGTMVVDVAVYNYMRTLLQIRWRRWLTSHYLDRWSDRQNYYRLQIAGNPSDNPDQRISDDINQFIELALSLTMDLLNSIVTLLSFLFILWHLSSTLILPWVHGMAVPGYLVWAALFYSIAGTLLTIWIGRPLVRLKFNQQKYEADFRFSLVRFRENSESIAFYKGEQQEKTRFLERFSRIFTNFLGVMMRTLKLDLFTGEYAQIATIFPYIVCAASYFSKGIKLGGMMQTASAFGQVQSSFSYIINSYTYIASLQAGIARLTEFENNLEIVSSQSRITPQLSQEGFAIQDLSIDLPNGTPLLRSVTLAVKPGEWVLVRGPSGSGKSTLLRTLAGLWPYAEGSMRLPAAGQSLFVPQKLYLPLGTLRSALCYPDPPMADDDIIRVLQQCGLSHYAGRLEEQANWSQILSPGEQQRIAFARILLLKRPYVFLDEATSALDEQAEEELYGLLKATMDGLTVVSVAHRSTLKKWHGQELSLPEKS